jgi:hypothetical protein
MSRLLRRCLNRLPLAPESRKTLIDRWIPATFGQLGEDAVIDNHLGWLGLAVERPGLYLDIGGHHPTSGSNTYRFYRRDAYGFVVDVGPPKRRLWQKIRPRDHFIDAAVVPNSWPDPHVLFYASQGYGSGTDCVQGFGVGMPATPGLNLVRVPALRAGDLAAQVLSHQAWLQAPWRLLNVDIEGLDQEVLLDLCLDDLKPDVVAVESFIPATVSNWDKLRWYTEESPLVQSLSSLGYSLQSVCGPTLIFVRINSLKR